MPPKGAVVLAVLSVWIAIEIYTFQQQPNYLSTFDSRPLHKSYKTFFQEDRSPAWVDDSPMRLGGPRPIPKSTFLIKKGGLHPSDVIHVAYALDAYNGEGNFQIARLAKSIWSLFLACDRICRYRLKVHVFFDPNNISQGQLESHLSRPVFWGLDLNLHPMDFERKVTTHRKVWGYTNRNSTDIIKKLSSPANYYRFYIPQYLVRLYGASSVLYLYVDTLIMGSKFHGLFEPPLPVVSAGSQGAHCRFGQMILLDDPRVANLGIADDETCLTASVMLINTTEWLRLNLTREIETLLSMNQKKKLWHLGSMPPLMLALRHKWANLHDAVQDSKGKTDFTWFQSVLDKRKNQSTIFHPVKDASWINEPPEPEICFTDGNDIMDETGSRRIKAQQTQALARILNTRTKPIAGVHCDIVVTTPNGLSEYKTAQLNSSVPWVVFGIKDPAVNIISNSHIYIYVSDNEYIEGALISKNLATARLHLVEDIQPPIPVHRPRDLQSFDVPLLCYHGNAMHITSLLPHLMCLNIQAFTLRIILAENTHDEFLVYWNQLHEESNCTQSIQLQLLGYDPGKIHHQLVECDVGLAPNDISPKTPKINIAMETRDLYRQTDVQAKDVLRRCKITANGGRQFIFMQIGVPTIAGACPENIMFSFFGGKPLVEVAYTWESWGHHIITLLENFCLRMELSISSRDFSMQYLTTKLQAFQLLEEISYYYRMHDRQGRDDLNMMTHNIKF